MRLRLNLATKPLVTHRRFLLGAGVLGGLAGLLFLVLGVHVYQVRKADREFRARIAQVNWDTANLRGERAKLEEFFSQVENAKLNDRATYLNSLIDARSFNWTQMFMDLERVLPGGVHVVSIVPKLSGDHVEVKLTVGATSDEAKLKFLRAVETSKELTHVELLSEHTPTGNESGDQALLELNVWYSRI